MGIHNLFNQNARDKSEKRLRVRIVCYEDVNAWILGKIARKLYEELSKLNVDVDISKNPDSDADINHHIIYYNYNGKKSSTDTLMITHVDSLKKLNMIKKQMNSARLGICMSKDTLNKLINQGVPKHKLCYVNPAQDSVILPKPVVIGLTSNTHNDFRKRESFIIDICKTLDPKYFKFKIMGSGWKPIIEEMIEMGFQVEYQSEFNYEVYIKLIPTFDYYLYFGFDEGSMGFLDALRAGVGTIVTPQGYHLDIRGGITYSCNDLSDFVDAFDDIYRKRKNIVESVRNLTWDNYASKHLELWNYILHLKPLGEILNNSGKYIDGIFSLLLEDIYK